MAGLIYRFLPAHPAKVRRCALSPWFDAECRSFRRRARRHERQYRRTKLAADRSAWVHFVRGMHRSYREKERTYWETKIVSHAKDPKRLWATFDALLGRRRADRQPDVSLFSAEDFLSSFNDKINGIRLETAGADPPVYPATDCRLFQSPVLNFVASSSRRRPNPVSSTRSRHFC